MKANIMQIMRLYAVGFLPIILFVIAFLSIASMTISGFATAVLCFAVNGYIYTKHF